MYKVQIQCYEDAKLMKLFPEIIRSLYDQDVLAEDTILHWFRKGTNPKGRCVISWVVLLRSVDCGFIIYLVLKENSWYCRQTFVKSLEPFIKWLEEAEEEE